MNYDESWCTENVYIIADLSKTKAGIGIYNLTTQKLDLFKINLPDTSELEKSGIKKSDQWRVMRDEFISKFSPQRYFNVVGFIIEKANAFSTNKWSNQIISQVIASILTIYEIDFVPTLSIPAQSLSAFKRREAKRLKIKETDIKKIGIELAEQRGYKIDGDDDLADVVCLLSYFRMFENALRKDWYYGKNKKD